MDRKQFIQHSLGVLKQKLVSSLTEKLEQVTQPLVARRFVRPPGAQPETLFLSLCTRCDACTAACPHEAISVHYGSGYPYDGAPVLSDLRTYPCLLCEDTPCIPVCPTEALQPVSSVSAIHLGTAVIDRLACSAFSGSGCQVCYDVCPLKDSAIQMIEGLPFVQNEACTGCGICQHQCPEEPEAIRIIPAGIPVSDGNFEAQ